MIRTFRKICRWANGLKIVHRHNRPGADFTKVNTETIYLMLSEAIDVLQYRRVEWKCDALNARSRAAALRLGFSFEGIFRQHYIIKGRNRDTAWFAMLDSDWPAVKRNMSRWLYSDETRFSLAKLNQPLLQATGFNLHSKSGYASAKNKEP